MKKICACGAVFDPDEAAEIVDAYFDDNPIYSLEGYEDWCAECAISDYEYRGRPAYIDSDLADIYMCSGEDEDYTFGNDPDELRKYYT